MRLSLILLAIPTLALAQQPISHQAAQKLAQATFSEYLELLALPNDAINAARHPEERRLPRARVQEARLRTRKQLENKGKPMLFAEWPKKHRRREDRALLHAPRRPAGRRRRVVAAQPLAAGGEEEERAGQLGIIPTDALFATASTRSFACSRRSSSDDKAPIMMFLAAFDGLSSEWASIRRSTSRCCSTARRKRARRRSRQSLLPARISCLRRHRHPRRPAPPERAPHARLRQPRRRLASRLSCYGPKQPLHSGHFGNYVPNPAMRLSRLIASMKDDEGPRHRRRLLRPRQALRRREKNSRRDR